MFRNTSRQIDLMKNGKLNISHKTIEKEKAPLLSVHNYGLEISSGSMEWKDFHFETENAFHINKIEDYIRLSKHKEFPLPPHRKEVFDFIFLTKGKTIRTKSLDSYEFAKNQFFFLPAYQITAMTSMTKNASGYYCHFASDIFFNKLTQKEILDQFTFLQFTGNPIVEVDESTALFVVSILTELEKEYRSGEQCNLDMVAAALLTLFFSVNRFAKPEKNITDVAAFRIASGYKNLLLKHIFEKQKVKLYADMLAVSPEHLNRSVKCIYGKSAHQYLDEMILLEAKVLLRQSTLNISEISYKIGKENPGDFARFFRLKTGITPKQYRLNI